CGIEEAKRGAAISALRQLDDIVVDIAEPAEKRAHLATSGEVLPDGVAGKPPPQTVMRHRPASMQEIEVAPARDLVALRVVGQKGHAIHLSSPPFRIDQMLNCIT